MRFTHISSCGIDPQLLMYGPKKLILTLSDADLQAGPRMRFTRPRLGCEAPPRREGRGPGQGAPGPAAGKQSEAGQRRGGGPAAAAGHDCAQAQVRTSVDSDGCAPVSHGAARLAWAFLRAAVAGPHGRPCRGSDMSAPCRLPGEGASAARGACPGRIQSVRLVHVEIADGRPFKGRIPSVPTPRGGAWAL